MKARMIFFDEQLQLLLCNGKVRILTLVEARDFLLSFSDPSHYAGDGTWNNGVVTMENYGGETIAIVDDSCNLIVSHGDWFKKIVETDGVSYISAKEFAEKHGKQAAIVRRLCMNGRIPGAFQKGRTWLIPEGTPYPTDARAGKRVN